MATPWYNRMTACEPVCLAIEKLKKPLNPIFFKYLVRCPPV